MPEAGGDPINLSSKLCDPGPFSGGSARDACDADTRDARRRGCVPVSPAASRTPLAVQPSAAASASNHTTAHAEPAARIVRAHCGSLAALMGDDARRQSTCATLRDLVTAEQHCGSGWMPETPQASADAAAVHRSCISTCSMPQDTRLGSARIFPSRGLLRCSRCLVRSSLAMNMLVGSRVRWRGGVRSRPRDFSAAGGQPSRCLGAARSYIDKECSNGPLAQWYSTVIAPRCCRVYCKLPGFARTCGHAAAAPAMRLRIAANVQLRVCADDREDAARSAQRSCIAGSQPSLRSCLQSMLVLLTLLLCRHQEPSGSRWRRGHRCDW